MSPWTMRVLVCAAAGLLAAAGARAADDTLYTVDFDTATATERLEIVDPATGSLTTVRAGIQTVGCP